MKVKTIALLIRRIILTTIFVTLPVAWLIAMSVVWMRVFSPYLPNCFVTNLLQSIIKVADINEIIAVIRESALYKAFSYAARDTEGTLAPLKFLLEIMGTVSFLLGALNELKSTRSYGMLMGEVISCAFPFHIFVQVFLYGGFAVLGGYSCQLNIGSSAALCLYGLGVCFVYTLWMTWCIFISKSKKRRVVELYIDSKTNPLPNLYSFRSLFPKCKKAGDSILREEVSVCALDFARYVGEQWNAGTSLQIHRGENALQEEFLATLVLRVIAPSSVLEDTGYTLYKIEGKAKQRIDRCTLISNCLIYFFPKAKEHLGKEAEYILFVNFLHFSNGGESAVNDAEKFRKNILCCSLIWEQLFNEVKDENRRTQMTCEVLKSALLADWPVFAMLSFGLLHQLGVARIGISEKEYKDNILKIIDFLFEVQKAGDRNLINRTLEGPPFTNKLRLKLIKKNKKERIHTSTFDNACGEMIYLAAGILQWVVLSEGFNQNDFKIWISGELALRVKKCGIPKEKIVSMCRDAKTYSILAYLLFTVENTDRNENMTVNIFHRLEPIVRETLEHICNGGI